MGVKKLMLFMVAAVLMAAAPAFAQELVPPDESLPGCEVVPRPGAGGPAFTPECFVAEPDDDGSFDEGFDEGFAGGYDEGFTDGLAEEAGDEDDGTVDDDDSDSVSDDDDDTVDAADEEQECRTVERNGVTYEVGEGCEEVEDPVEGETTPPVEGEPRLSGAAEQQYGTPATEAPVEPAASDGVTISQDGTGNTQTLDLDNSTTTTHEDSYNETSDSNNESEDETTTYPRPPRALGDLNDEDDSDDGLNDDDEEDEEDE